MNNSRLNKVKLSTKDWFIISQVVPVTTISFTVKGNFMVNNHHFVMDLD